MLIINKERISFNLDQYAPFVASELIMMEAVKAGADRQKIHEILRNISMTAWAEIQKGKTNPMIQLLMSDKLIGHYLNIEQLEKLLSVKTHIGDAPERAKKLIKKIKTI